MRRRGVCVSVQSDACAMRLPRLRIHAIMALGLPGDGRSLGSAHVVGHVPSMLQMRFICLKFCLYHCNLVILHSGFKVMLHAKGGVCA